MSEQGRLLEREVQLDRFAEAISDARRGMGSLIVVEGAAGSGKTSLLDSAQRAAQVADLWSFSATGAEIERELPFGVVRQLFELRLRGLPADVRKRAFKGAAALAAPLVEGRPEGGVDLSSLAPAVSLLHGLYWLLVNLSEERPLILTVDDAQWADLSSLRLVEFLSRRIAELPVLVLVATRETSFHGEERLAVDPLSPQGAAMLVGEVFGAPVAEEFAAACHAATAGNPFYLRELLRELVAAEIDPIAEAAERVSRLGSGAVASAVLARIAGRPDCARVASALAVLGENSATAMVAELSELDEQAVGAELAALTKAGLLADRSPPEFIHPLVRSALYNDLPASERALMHQRAAGLLHAAGRLPEEIATQLLSSEPAGERWRYDVLVSAAAGAGRRGASETAIRCLRRAIDELPSAVGSRVLGDLGALEARVGDEAAIDHLEAALESAETAADQVAAARRLAPALVGREQIDRAADLLGNLARSLEAQGDSDLALELRADLIGLVLLEPGRARDAVERPADLECLPGTTPAERIVLANLAQWKAMVGEPATAVMPLVERALADGRLSDEATAESPAFNYCAFLLVAAERFDEAEELLEGAVAQSVRRGSLLGYWLASLMRSLVAYRTGDLARAELEARGVVDGAAAHDWTLAYAAAFLIDALIERGEFSEAESVLEGTWPEDREIPDQLLYYSLLAARGRLRITRSRVREGVDDLLEIGRRCARNGMANAAGAPTHRSYAVPGLLRLGEHEQALVLAEEELEIAETWGTPRGIGIAQQTRALAAEGAERLALLEAACETLRPTPARLDLARALAALGAQLRRQREVTAARVPLREARELAALCGARPLEQYAETELAASGVRRRARVMLSGVEALTPSEHRVATLAADGLSNAEIAQSLFVTRKTVEMHLGHGYRKLGIGSRGELPDALAPPKQ